VTNADAVQMTLMFNAVCQAAMDLTNDDGPRALSILLLAAAGVGRMACKPASGEPREMFMRSAGEAWDVIASAEVVRVKGDA